jgi:hypothetical protein
MDLVHSLMHDILLHLHHQQNLLGYHHRHHHLQRQPNNLLMLFLMAMFLLVWLPFDFALTTHHLL